MIAVEARAVSKRYRAEPVQHVRSFGDLRSLVRREHTWALQGIDLRVDVGETVGFVGRNGSGKSTLLRLIAGVSKPTSGVLRVGQPVTGFLTLGDSLAMDMTGAENAYTNALLAGLSRREAASRLDEIAEFAELGDAMDFALRTYSDGMRLRLAFAVSVALNPKLLIVDEVLTVGDTGFMAKCIDRMHELQRRGVTALITSHSLGQIEQVAERVVWIDNGRIVTVGSTAEVTQRYAEALAREGSASLGSSTDVLREGTGEVELTEVSLLHADGTEALVVRPDECLTVRIGYRASSPVSKPVFGFSIGHIGGGARIVDLHTDADGHVIDRIHGVGVVEVQVAPLALAGGDYALDAGIYSSSWDRTFDHHYQALRFSMASPFAPGPLAPRHEWLHRPESAAPRRSDAARRSLDEPALEPDPALVDQPATVDERVDHLPADPHADPRSVEPTPVSSMASMRELGLQGAIALAVCAALAAIVFGPNVRRGTFVSDDWSSMDSFRHLGGHTMLRYLRLAFGARPLLAVVLTAFPAVFGTADATGSLVASVGLGVMASVLFALLLSTLGMRRWLALAAGALTLVFPWSDSTRLWPTGAASNAAVCLLLIALIIGVRGARRPDGLRAVGLEVLVAGLLVAGVLTNEAVAGIALIAGAGYFRLMPRRSAAWRWGLHLATVVAAIAYTAASTTRYTAPWTVWLRHLGQVGTDSIRLELRALLPVPVSDTLRVLVFAVAATLVLRVWQNAAARRRGAINRAVGLLVAGWVILLVGFAPMVLSAYVTPLSETLDNGSNIVAMYGPVLSVIGLLMLALALLAPADVAPVPGGDRKAAVVAAGILALAIVSLYASRVGDDVKTWVGASQERAEVIDRVHGAASDLPSGQVVYVWGHRGLAAPGLPVFADTWDLGSALRLRYDDPKLRAYAVFAGAQFSCDADAMRPISLPGLHWNQAEPGALTYDTPSYGKDHGAPYGHITFVDVRSGRRMDVVDRPTCQSVLRTIDPSEIGP